MSEQYAFIVGNNWVCWAFEPPVVRSDGSPLQEKDTWWESDAAVARVYLNGQWTSPTNAHPGVYAIKTSSQNAPFPLAPFQLTGWTPLNLAEFSYNGTTGFIAQEPNAYECLYSISMDVGAGANGGGYFTANATAPQSVVAGNLLFFDSPNINTGAQTYNPLKIQLPGASNGIVECIINPCRPQVNLVLPITTTTGGQLIFQVFKAGIPLFVDYAVIEVVASASPQTISFSCCPDMLVGDYFRIRWAGPGTATFTAARRIDIMDTLPPASTVTTRVKKNGVVMPSQNTVTSTLAVPNTITVTGSMRFTAAVNDVISLEISPSNYGLTVQSAMMNIQPDP
jgi:hypothetical protein